MNVKSIFHLTRALLPLLEKAGENPEQPSRVINIGSVAGIDPQPFPTYAYDCSKAAVHHLTRKLAIEFSNRANANGGKGRVTVNAIAPGYVPTNMSKGLNMYVKGGSDTLSQNIPMGRMGCSFDMMGAVLYLSSKASSWVTGIVLVVDGGQTAKL